MAEENENQEPKEGEEEQSMDEILGSIREILSDEDQENQSEAVASANDTEEEQVDESDATQSSEPEESSSEDAELADPESTSDTAVQDVEATSDPESDTGDQMEANEAEDATDNEAEDATGNEPSYGGSESEDNSDTEEPNEFLELTKDMIAPPPPDFDAGSPIVSGATQTASADPLQELAKALLNRRDIAIGNRDMTLEGLIREILRPLLKEWLDDNLPYLIERLVKKEIDHMVNKAERLDL